MGVVSEALMAAVSSAGGPASLGAGLMLLLGGLALFLLGMDQLTEGLTAMAGTRFKRLLARFAGNRFSACASGVVVTAAMESSSATSVLLVGFISAGFMTLGQAVAILLGAGIGSTFTVQIIAFQITAYAPIALFAGFVLQRIARRRRYRFSGQVVMAVGLIFFGLGVMSDATYPLRGYQPALDFLAGMDNPVLGILVGIGFTAVVQSSAATAGIVIAMASGGLITLDAAIALVLGANVGTCITGIIAAVGKPTAAMQAAVAHLIFKVIGTAALAPFIPQLAELAQFVSPVADPALPVAERLAEELPRQIANAATLLNVIIAVLLIGFVTPIAALTRWIVPHRETEAERAAKPRFLDAMYLENPAVALEKVNDEIARQGRHVCDILQTAPEAVIRGDVEAIQRLREETAAAESLHEAILDYLSDLAEGPVLHKDAGEAQMAATVSTSIQGAADVVSQHLLPVAEEYEERGLPLSLKMAEYLSPLSERALANFAEAVDAVPGYDTRKAKNVLSEKQDIKELAREARQGLMGRLGGRDEERLRLFRQETEVVEALKRIHYYARLIAKAILRNKV